MPRLLLALLAGLCLAGTPLKKVTLKGENLKLVDVFRQLAEVSELNIIVSETVRGTVSLNLTDVPWDEAIDVILKTYALKAERTGNVLVIRKREQAR